MIKPSIGRHVLFIPAVGDIAIIRTQSNKHAAVITEVHPDGRVNLAVFGATGHCFNYEWVPLLQPEDDQSIYSEHGFYCEWMEYQKGQAKKTDELIEHMNMTENLRALDKKSDSMDATKD